MCAFWFCLDLWIFVLMYRKVVIHSAAERRPDVSEKNPTATWVCLLHIACLACL
jgi:hypothetical protein